MKIDVRPADAADKPDDQCYVRNSSFLSRDIEAQKARADTLKKGESPPRVGSPRKVALPPKTETTNKTASPPMKMASAPGADGSPVTVRRSASTKESSVPKLTPPPKREKESPPKNSASAPPICDAAPTPMDLPKVETPVNMDTVSPPKNVISAPMTALKITKSDSKIEENFTPKVPKRESSIVREAPLKAEKLSLVATEASASIDKIEAASIKNQCEGQSKGEESNGVGDKIKKFEKAAEDASAERVTRAGSVRGRPRANRLGSDREDPPPPATPFKDNVHFDLPTPTQDKCTTVVERQHSFTGNNSVNSIAARWQRNDSTPNDEKPRPEPQKIIKPEFKPMPSPAEVTIRSPSLGAKIADRFPSHGTAFRNVASPDPTRTRDLQKLTEEPNNFRTCKLKSKEKYSVSKGSSYFTRGSEEIWLVKKKDIEEIEERVLDSFRRAGGSVSSRAASEGGQNAFPHATTGRARRHAYARSESLDPQWAAARAQTLKRQASVACTCGHDKKPARPRSAAADAPPRPRSRSHGDDNSQTHVLDKYETLV